MKILFLCVGNSIRSQMAEGLAREILGDRAEILSAGIMPSYVHPMAIRAMKEVGIDISAHTSKHVDSLDVKGVELVVTLCAEQYCPRGLEGVRQLHWPLPDPVGAVGSEEQRMARFREVRDEISKRLGGLKKELGGR